MSEAETGQLGPKDADKNERPKVKLPLSLILGCLVLLCGAASCSSRCDIYLIPKDSNGWYAVVFDQQGFPPLEAEGENAVFRFGADRILITSSILNEGHRRAEYFFTDAVGNRVRAMTSPIGGGGQIWDRHTSSRREIGKADLLIYCFFVGPETVCQRSSQNELEAQVESVRAKLYQRR